jgi:hypothetical protein
MFSFAQWHEDMVNATQWLRILQSILNNHTHHIWFGMGRDHTFIFPLGVDPALFHMTPLPFYLDDAMFDKEVKLWVGVIREETLKGIKYTIPQLCSELLLRRHQLLPPVQGKRDRTPPNSDEEHEEVDEETLPQGPLPIPFSTILDDAQISGKQFQGSPCL